MSYDEDGRIDVIRILAIDPGTYDLGIGVIDVDIDTFNPTLVYANGVNITKEIKNFPDIAELYSDTEARLYAIEKVIGEYLRRWKPILTACEAAYMGNHASAYMGLISCSVCIRRALRLYNSNAYLHMVVPSVVKKAVGVSGKSGDKALMVDAIKKLSDLTVANGVDLDTLNSHAIDAIAVAYGLSKERFKGDREYAASRCTLRNK